jgi:hypothetical protein
MREGKVQLTDRYVVIQGRQLYHWLQINPLGTASPTYVSGRHFFKGVLEQIPAPGQQG